MWQFNIPIIAKLFFDQLKKVAFGEFIDDLEIGDKMCEAIGLYDVDTEDSNDSTAEKTGEDRLGPKDVLKRMGPTLLISTIVFVLIIVILLLLLFCSKRPNVTV